MKLWDETVFGHSSLPAGPPGGADQERGGGRGRGGRGSDGGRGGGEGWRGRGGARGGKSEWRELADPVTFASVEVRNLPYTPIHNSDTSSAEFLS